MSGQLRGILGLTNRLRIVEHDTNLQDVLRDTITRAKDRVIRIAFVNAHSVNMAWRDRAFRENLASCETLFRDGIGVKVMLKALGRSPGLNLNGTDLIPIILKHLGGWDAALFGTETSYLERASARLREYDLNVTVLVDGFQDDRVYLDAVRSSSARLVVLAMGMPKQERVARLLAAELGQGCLVICAGAFLDFLAGKVLRAPLALRNAGLEWLYRLAQEPRRLFRRYVVGNAVFLLRVAVLALRVRILRNVGDL